MSDATLSRRSRIRGCLLGLAIGDALGAPVAGLKGGHVRQVFGEIDSYVDGREVWAERPQRWRMPGLHAAKTQQALAVALISAQGLGAECSPSVAALWKRMAFEPREANLPLGAFRGASGTFRRALQAMREGEEFSGQPSAGAGPAACVAPFGIGLCDDPDGLTRTVTDVALLTHTDPRAIAGALAAAHAVTLLLHEPDPRKIDLREFLVTLKERVRAGEERLLIDHLGRLNLDRELEADPVHAFSRSLEAVAALIEENDRALAWQTLLRQANHLGPRQPLSAVTIGFAPLAIPIALHAALSAEGPAVLLSALVTEGRDSDTVGAITGALLGARWGEELLPQEWREGLLGGHAIEMIADALAGEGAGTDETEFVEQELSLTRREEEARAPLLSEAERRRAKMAQRRPAKPKPPEPEAKPFAPPPQTYLSSPNEDPAAKKRDRALRGRKRIDWKEQRRRDKRG